MADPTVRDTAVEALARQVVADVSPAELPLFSATAARYRADPAGTLTPRGGDDQVLGFGAETAVVLITPFALDLVRRLLSRLSEKLGDSAADSLAGRITAWFSRGSKQQPAADPAPEPLSPGQLRMIAETARSEAASLALPPEESERLADAIVATLATRT